MTARLDETLARSALYELLSVAFLYPGPGMQSMLLGAARGCRAGVASRRWREIDRAMRTLTRRLSRIDDREIESQYVRVFGHTVSKDCAPYESEYGQAHVFQKSQTLSDLASFYKAFGVVPNPDLKDRQDHISVEMEFMHLLTLKETHARRHNHGSDKVSQVREAQEKFLADHLAGWVMTFADRLKKKTAPGGLYEALARVLGLFMGADLRRFNLDPAVPDPSDGEESGDESLECEPTALPVNIPSEVR